MKTSAASGLADLLGPDRVVREEAERASWSVAGRTPDAVVFPRTTDELAEVLGTASERGWPVLPAGAGGWLGGGGPPNDVRLVVSTRRMRAVTEYEPGDLTLTGEAGLPLAELEERAAEHGQWLPQDPPAWRRATLGAFVSTGLPGPLVAAYGRPRDQLLGLTAVTGDGRIVRAGGRVVKNVAGYDLVRLLTGSWGTLGVIAGATVRLFPRPERDVTLLLRAPGAADLVGAGRALAAAPVVPEALELLAPFPDEGRDDDGGSASERRPETPAGGGRASRVSGAGGAVLAVRLLGSMEAVSEKERIVREAAGAEPDGRLEGEGSASFHEHRAAAAPEGGLALRLSLLPARLERLLDAGQEVLGRARARGFRTRLAAHVTRGVVRIEARAPSGDDAFGDDWIGYLVGLRQRIRDDGGSMTLVRGPAPLARAVGYGGDPGEVARLLRGLREELDPSGILAPGRLGVPGAGA